MRNLLILLLATAATAGAADLQIISRAEWEALEPKPYASQKPVRFTIHHSAVPFDKSGNAAAHIKNIQAWGMGEDREWSDIPYHFIISPKGEIFEGRDPKVRGESNTPYDTEGHLQINCLGNFQEQELTPEQLDALARLLAWASKEYDIPTSTISGHRDQASTACPGENLYALIDSGKIRRLADAIIEEEAKRDQKNAGK